MMRPITDDQATGGHSWEADRPSHRAWCSACGLRVKGILTLKHGWIDTDLVLEELVPCPEGTAFFEGIEEGQLYHPRYDPSKHRCTRLLTLAKIKERSSKFYHVEDVTPSKIRWPAYYGGKQEEVVAYSCAEEIDGRIFVYAENLRGERLTGNLFFQEPEDSRWLVSGTPDQPGRVLFGIDDACEAVSSKIHHEIITPAFNARYASKSKQRKATR